MLGSWLALLSKLQVSSCFTHVGREGGAAQPRGHAELVALLRGIEQRARETIAILEQAPTPATPVGAQARAGDLAAQRDIERAYRELLGALSAACGATCNPA